MEMGIQSVFRRGPREERSEIPIVENIDDLTAMVVSLVVLCPSWFYPRPVLILILSEHWRKQGKQREQDAKEL